MKKIKQSLALASIILVSALGLVFSPNMQGRAKAAFTYSGPALCHQSLLPSNGQNVFPCNSPGSLQVEGGSFQTNTCYKYGTRANSSSFWWVKTDCGVGPFSIEYTCNDNSKQRVAYNIDEAAACTGHGGPNNNNPAGTVVNGKICGAGSNAVRISIDIGCRGVGNPILDMMFAFTRFLSVGVGIVVVGSTIVAGIQYTTSRGDPQATVKALTRVSKAGAALALYLLSFALLQYLIPGGLF